MLIDFHTHCFPDKIAEHAMKTLVKSGNINSFTNGTKSGLLESMNKFGVDISVVMNIATNEKQVLNVNKFAYELTDDKTVGFASIYPFADDVFLQLDYIKEKKFKGIKLHPEFQNFYPDDERLKPIYKKISEMGLIVLFHSGFDVSFKPPFKCMPKNLLNAKKYLDCNVVAAHFGGYRFYEDVYKYLCGEEIYFDTSLSYGMLDNSLALKMIEKHGTDKIMFGTDSPWHTPKMEIEFIESLNLSENEKEKIYYKNALKLLN